MTLTEQVKILDDPPGNKTSWRRRNYVSLYVSNETPNDVLVERRQDVSVVRLYDVF